MPWLAQRHGLPDTHKQYADPGSELERVYRRLGYVEVSAPGSGEPDEVIEPHPQDPPVDGEHELVDEAKPVAVETAGKKRKAAES